VRIAVTVPGLPGVSAVAVVEVLLFAGAVQYASAGAAPAMASTPMLPAMIRLRFTVRLQSG
jgi:hypothetical protein